MRIERWNYERNNTNFDPELEVRMLAEEAQEFKDGMAMLYKAENDDKVLEAAVELIDAWADYKFVLTGTQYKILGYSGSFDLNLYISIENYMYTTLINRCEISPTVLRDALEAVIDANEAKGKTKVNGKIQKGDSWKDPKEVILGLLLDA